MIVDAIYFDFNCIQRHALIDIRTTSQQAHGITRPNIVIVNGELTGFIKNSAVYDDIDLLELFLNYLGRRLGIRFSDEYYIIQQRCNRLTGLLSIRDHMPGYSFFEMDRALSLFWRKKRNAESAAIAAKWQQLMSLKDHSIDYLHESTSLCRNIDDCHFAIELPLVAMASAMPACDLGSFIDSYIKMILFDLAIGNTDRTLENYGILLDENCGRIILAGLYDSATLRKPLFPPNCYALNGLVFETELVIDTLFLYYPKLAKKIYDEMARILRDSRDTIELNSRKLTINQELISILLHNIDHFTSRSF